MKNTSYFGFLAAVLCLTISLATPASAIPVGSGDQPGDFLLGAEDLGSWSFGGYYLDRERYAVINHNPRNKMASIKTMAYIGYEPLHGLITYVIGGNNNTSFNNSPGESQQELGAGVQLNILNHLIPDPLLLEDRITLNGNAQFTKSGGKFGARDIEWDEISGTLTVGLVNDLDGSKFYNANGLGVFAGLAFSELSSSSLHAKSALGYVGGVQIFYSESITFEIGMESLDNAALFLSLNVDL